MCKAWQSAAAFGLAVLLTLGGCSGSSSTLAPGNGQALVSLTDAAGTFLTYTVDVKSLTLTKQDGTIVSTVPRTTRVDFTQLAELSEFLTAATVPAGRYKSVVMQLDYSNADIEVDDGTGTPVNVATIQDRSGSTITTLSVSLDLDTAHPLVVAVGLPSALQLDFDLDASNTVDMTVPTSPVLTVDPVLSASLSFDASKPHRLRGPLASVDTNAGSFQIGLRPFHLLSGDFGKVTIYTTTSTTFEIDGTDYTGAAGLTQLAAEPALTATVAVVTPDTATGHLVASEVYAGSSVAFGTSDVVTGNVIARSGDSLTVRGATLVRADGTLTFHETVKVTLGTDTKVTKQGLAAAGLSKDSISVGQRISAFGAWDNATQTLDATDPTKGPVRMLITQLNGNTVGTPSGQVLTMALNQINGHLIGLFDFSGTGSPNADPNNYAVNVASGIDISAIADSTPLRARGFVVPFGLATAADDFDAITIIDVDHGPANLLVGWPRINAVTTPFLSYAAGGMTLSLTSSGLVHEVRRSGVVTTLAKSDTPTVNAQSTTNGLFIISYHGVIQMYTTLSSYQAALQTRLGSGQVARFFAAHGTYDDADKTLLADSMYMLLE